MRLRYALMVALVTISPALALSPSKHSPVSAKHRSPALDRPASASFALDIELEQRRYERSESIVPKIGLRNLTGAEQGFSSCGFWKTHRVVILDENGDPPPSTDLGKRLTSFFDTKGIRDHRVPLSLPAGATYWYEPSVDVSKSFRLAPGQYSLQIIYDDFLGPPPLFVASNRIHFVVH